MNTKVTDSTEQLDNVQELADLGKVSEETKGGFVGHSLDGGFGVKKP